MVVAKRPQIAAMIKQQAHAARPPTGPSAAPIGLTILDCLTYTHTRVSVRKEKTKEYIYKQNLFEQYYLVRRKKKIRFVYFSLFSHT